MIGIAVLFTLFMTPLNHLFVVMIMVCILERGITYSPGISLDYTYRLDYDLFFFCFAS